MGDVWRWEGVSWDSGSQEIIKPTITIGFKMEDVYILYNIIEILWWRKVTKIEKGRPIFKLQITLAQLCNN